MPIQATFQDDFTDFQRAVDAAEVSLKGFEDGATKVEGSLNRMVDNFSGRKVISEATLMLEAIERVGGVSKLTEAELARAGDTAATAAEKMKALGMDVPPGMQALADTTKAVGTETSATTALLGGLGRQLAGMFTVGAVIAFGKEILETGSRIQKMAEQTGLAVDQIQRLEAIAGTSSTEMGSMVRAIQDMQEKLGSGDAGLIGGLAKLGINLDEFKKLNAYDQFIAIGDAIGKIEDPTEQAARAADIFGRTWRELMPALKSDMVEIAAKTRTMSDESVAAWDAIGAAAGRTYRDVKTSVGELLGPVAGLIVKYQEWRDEADKVVEAGNKLADPAAQLAGALASVEHPAIAVGAAMGQAALSTEELGRMLGGAEDELKAAKLALEAEEAATKAAEAAAKKYADELARFEGAYTRVNEQSRGYEAILADIDGELVTHISKLLEAGASVDDLALAYSLSKVQIEAMKDALDATTKAHELADRATRTTIALQDELYLMAIERSGTASDIQQAHIQHWGDAYKLQLSEAGTATQEQYDLIDQIVGERTQDMMVDWDLIKSHSRAALQETADQARANYETMAADTGNYSDETIRHFEDIAIAAQEAADNWGSAFITAAEDMEDAADRASLSWSEAMDLVGKGQGTMTGTVGGGGQTAYWGSAAHVDAVQNAYNAGRYFGPVVVSDDGRSLGPDYEALGMPTPRAAGGPVAAGRPYLVGERGPELFMPTQAGGILPNGAGGGVVQNIVFQVNGTGEQVARVVSEEITRLMRVGRKWPAV